MPLRAPAVPGGIPAARSRAVSTAIWLGAIVGLSIAARIVSGATATAPAIFPDELIYWELGRSVGESGHFLIGDQPAAVWTYGPLYPLLIAPAHVFSNSLVGAYAVAKVINALFMSLAAVPAYFLARRLLSTRGSLVVAGLSVLVPSAVYTTRIMAESLSYPLFICAMLAMTTALERPTVARQLVALATIGLAVLTRFQMVILLPAFAGAFVLLAWVDARGDAEPPFRRRLRPFRFTWIASGLAVLGLFTAGALTSLGAHIAVLGELHLLRAPAKVVWHIADLDLYVGVIPLAAFLLLLWSALSAGTYRRTKAFAATSATTAGSLVLLAGVYSTAFAHVFDRYVFYVVPVFLIALVAWIERRVPSPSTRVVAGVGIFVAALPLTIPFTSLLNGREWGTSTSSAGLVPWVWAAALVGNGWLLNALATVFAGVLAFAFVSRRAAPDWGLVRVTAMLFVLFGLLITVSNSLLSRDYRRYAGSNDLTWIDGAAGSAQVAIVYSSDTRRPKLVRLALREAEFFNRSIGPVYDLQGPFAGGFPSTRVHVAGAGRILDASGQPVQAEYVLAHRTLAISGQLVARDNGSGLGLYRVNGPVLVRAPRHALREQGPT